MLILDKENPLATKVQTRDGRAGRIICIDRNVPESKNGTIVALIKEGEIESIYSYSLYGYYLLSAGEHPNDLIRIPEHGAKKIEIDWDRPIVMVHGYTHSKAMVANKVGENDILVASISFLPSKVKNQVDSMFLADRYGNISEGIKVINGQLNDS